MNRRPVVKINLDSPAEPRRRPDDLATEEPLEIRLSKTPLAVTMRTPGNDIDLAMGFLLTEGIISAAGDVVTAQLCAGTDTPNTYNVVDIVLGAGVPPPVTDPSRNFYTTSSCGVCGKASIEAIRTRSHFDVAGRADDPLGQQETHRQVDVVARGAHGDRERRFPEPDLQGLLGREVIGPPPRFGCRVQVDLHDRSPVHRPRHEHERRPLSGHLGAASKL